MAYNVPDDWNYFYCKCEDCGDCYHQSEGGCGCCDDEEDNEDTFTSLPDDEEEDAEEIKRQALRDVLYIFNDPYCRIEGTSYGRASITHSDDLGDILYKNDLAVHVSVVDREGWDELEFTMDNWLLVKKIIGYGEGDISD